MVIILLRRKLKALLEQADPDSAVFETEQLIKWVTGGSSLFMPPDSEVNEEAAQRAIEAAQRRIKGEPLQYIIGEWDFYGLTFKVGEGVLIPRPETELLVETALNELPDNGKIIDLCSGSGCIPIAIAKNADCRCWGIEISDKALEYFRENIIVNDASDSVTAFKGDILNPDGELMAALPDKCDIITANPPYLTAKEMSSLQKEVRHEPETALFGGTDGLDFYRRIFSLWKDKLSIRGSFIVEVGDKQAESVAEIMKNEGLRTQIFSDLNNIKRTILGRTA